MKLKYTGTIEVKLILTSNKTFRVTRGTELVPAGQVMGLEYIKANFTAGDYEALNLIDPDRTERLCR